MPATVGSARRTSIAAKGDRFTQAEIPRLSIQKRLGIGSEEMICMDADVLFALYRTLHHMFGEGIAFPGVLGR